jgi:hypothetical protein
LQVPEVYHNLYSVPHRRVSWCHSPTEFPGNSRTQPQNAEDIVCSVHCTTILQGTKLGTVNDFGHTTLANLDSEKDSFILWIHLVIAFLMFPAAIFLMRRFSIGLKMRDTSLKITRTLAIENIPQLVGGLLSKP